jgi:hypothetical protein
MEQAAYLGHRGIWNTVSQVSRIKLIDFTTCGCVLLCGVHMVLKTTMPNFLRQAL